MLECFKKAIKIAASCVQSNPKLVGTYISILNKFFYYIQHINVKQEDIQSCIRSIQEKLPQATADGDEAARKIRLYWNNTIEYVAERKKADDAVYA